MSEDFLTGFAPLADDDARVLILGSMPSVASLTLGRYYGHPRNRFWPVMAALFPASADDLLSPDFDRRYAALKKNGVALWDTIGRCRREGSLDSAIRDWTPNDIGGFLQTHPDIGLIILNGKKSEAVWRKSWISVLSDGQKPLRILTRGFNSEVHRLFKKISARRWASPAQIIWAGHARNYRALRRVKFSRR